MFMKRRTQLVSGLIALPLALAIADAFAVDLTPVPSANTKAAGFACANALSPELVEVVFARGATALENPSTVASYYGYSNNGPMVPAPGDVQTATHDVEASKTEPDKNTYLVLSGQHGADPKYNYGTHFLFQGHEQGVSGYITRINLDADKDHRVTLFADKDSSGNPIPSIDGSTWYPWSRRLLFTSEAGANGGVLQATPDFPSTVENISGALGKGGYEGIQADSFGNLWIVEDVGGTTIAPGGRRPNSYLFRFVPKNPLDLKMGGKLQVLQVASQAHAGAIVWNPDAAASILSQDEKDLHTYGKVFDTQWLTIHDTDATNGNTPFDSNALARAAGGTPFKRPENGVFRPGTRFREFYFTETGDTNANTQAGSAFGGFGGLFKLTQGSPADNQGKLSVFYVSDVAHSGFDNIQFLTEDQLVAVEDAGDNLHAQRNALDSGFVFDARADYGNAANQPVRFLAQGRDASATIDSGLSGSPGFKNDGDNEITGFHVSDGDPSTNGILGAKRPKPFKDDWRVFYTQQHGDNVTYEILKHEHNGD
jgi:Bacterial protein of unknown function (DUF839)